MDMSRMRQLVSSTRPEERNSLGDENAETVNPNSLNRSGSDSRTDSSSSTMERRSWWLAILLSWERTTEECASVLRGSIVLWYWFLTTVMLHPFPQESSSRCSSRP